MSKSPRAQLKTLPIEQCQRGRYQPREHFDPAGLAELAESIRANGLLQPIIVRPIANDQYEIIAGERRWRACQLAGLDHIDCLVGQYAETQAAEMTTIENVIRVDLNPIEEAKAYQRLIDEFGYLHDEVAAAIGKSRSHITNVLRLLKLHPSVQRLVCEGRLGLGHAKVLVSLTQALQLELSQKCIARGWSVRKLESEARKLNEAIEVEARNRDCNLVHLERSLQAHLGSKVHIDFQDDRGQVRIDFNNLDILEGIINKITGPRLP